MDIVQIDEKLDGTTLSDIKDVFERCFGDNTDASVLDKVNEMLRLKAFLAYFQGELVGFKLGYEKSEGVFFSWIGGVLPGFQRRGVATMLMKNQHKSALRQGYREIQTEVSGLNRAMLIVNLKEGFFVRDSFHVESGECILLLSKTVFKKLTHII